MFEDRLRAAGLKVTNPRIKVLSVLTHAEPHHISAEELYKLLTEQNVDIGLATVYRVLTQFELAGLVKRHNFEGGVSIYELDDGAHHDHLVCTDCGSVMEFYDELIERQQHHIAEKKGFLVSDHNHTIYGVCAGCQAPS